MIRNMSDVEMRICQNCGAGFSVESEDFDFYKKIAVPPPTWCPLCRQQRRFSWRNERTLHRNKCAKTGRSLISGFAPGAGYIVYDRDLWWSDAWDPLDTGAEYDFSKPFFTQFHELMRRTPMPAVFNARTTNSEYTSHVGEMKNCYLVAASWGSENIAYGSRVNFCKDSQDVFGVFNCELCYELISSTKCYRTHFSQNCEACADSWFLFDCRGCANCIGCVNLRNKSYHIFNRPYSKEEYAKKIKELKLDTLSGIAAMREKFEEFKIREPHRYAALLNCQNVTGDSVYGASNCTMCFDIGGDTKDCKYVINGTKMEGVYDGYGVGVVSGLIYESVDTGDQGERMCFDIIVWSSTNAYYSYNCTGCSDIFGCVGLRKKQYCILNRQYSKSEYEKLRMRIITHMDEMSYISNKEQGTSLRPEFRPRGNREQETGNEGIEYRYGEFFPPELSPFGYNETVAQEYFPLTEAEAKAKGFLWRAPEPRQYKITKRPEELPESIADVSDSIVNEVIACANASQSSLSSFSPCTTAFRIIPQELQFYRRLNLPLPKLCPNCRHYARLTKRNPPRLWHRRCDCNGGTSDKPSSRVQAEGEQGTREYKNTAAHFHGENPCPNEFKTSYAPERKEIVYCETCYNAEIV